jgi:hypothetical protein
MTQANDNKQDKSQSVVESVNKTGLIFSHFSPEIAPKSALFAHLPREIQPA